MIFLLSTLSWDMRSLCHSLNERCPILGNSRLISKALLSSRQREIGIRINTSRYNFISEISSNFLMLLKNSLIILIAFYFLCCFSSMCLLLFSQIPSYRRLIFYFTTTAFTRECSFILSLPIFFRQEEHQPYLFRPIAKTFKLLITANQFTYLSCLLILHVFLSFMSYFAFLMGVLFSFVWRLV